MKRCQRCNCKLDNTNDAGDLCFACNLMKNSLASAGIIITNPRLFNDAVYNQWTKQKPVLDRECILLTLSFLSNGIPTIRVFSIYEQIINTEEYGGAYWGIFENGDEEWGDYDELEAEYYLILDYPERSEG